MVPKSGTVFSIIKGIFSFRNPFRKMRPKIKI